MFWRVCRKVGVWGREVAEGMVGPNRGHKRKDSESDISDSIAIIR